MISEPMSNIELITSMTKMTVPFCGCPLPDGRGSVGSSCNSIQGRILLPTTHWRQ